MPWRECSVTDERLQFVARRLAGESMVELCREFGISRKTGYKVFDRYQECGVQGLTDRSRRPYRYANQLPFQVENYILNVKREHPSWGARKIRERLVRRFTSLKVAKRYRWINFRTDFTCDRAARTSFLYVECGLC
jgi:transposase